MSKKQLSNFIFHTPKVTKSVSDENRIILGIILRFHQNLWIHSLLIFY